MRLTGVLVMSAVNRLLCVAFSIISIIGACMTEVTINLACTVLLCTDPRRYQSEPAYAFTAPLTIPELTPSGRCQVAVFSVYFTSLYNFMLSYT